MPINRLQGLQGLRDIDKRARSFDELSLEEKRKFINSNPKLSRYYNNPTVIRDYYDNTKFINTFGKDKFLALGNSNEAQSFRNNLLKQNFQQQKDNLIANTFKSTFGNDQNFVEMQNSLDTQGMYDLLKSNYLGSSEIGKRLKENAATAKKDAQYYENNKFSFMNSLAYSSPTRAGAEGLNQMAAAMTPAKIAELDAQDDKNILAKIYSQVQKRRENEVSGLTNNIYQKMLKTGELKKYYASFDALASLHSNYYAQFKNSDWLKDYSNTDRLKDYAKFLALSKQYGEGTAIQYLDRSIQDRVANAQDGKWTGNTLKKVATTAISDLGAQVAMWRNAGAFFDPERLGIINQGLDPNSPVYAKDKYNNIIKDKHGKPIIVGYNKNTNIWTNPAYWNDMYMYNTFSPEEIELIKQRGGVSKDVNVNPYGYIPNEHIVSWQTAQEGIAQSGHILASIAETALLGGAGKAIGTGANIVGKGAMMAAKAANASAKTLSTMSKIGRGISKTSGVANDILMNMAASMNGPQGEAMGTFNEQLEKNTEAVKDQIQKELHDFSKTINYNAPHAKQQIAQYYNQLKLQDARRLKLGAAEGTKLLPISDKTLIQQAKQLYANNLLKEQEAYLEQKHQKDYQEAATNAARTYTKNWAADFIKENLITGGIQKYKIAKGALTGALDNSIAKGIIADATTGGVKRAVGKAGEALKNATWKNLAKGTAKQVAGGFTDEFLDGLNADMAEGVGDKSFTDYLNKNYNPEAYNATVHGAFANVIAGIDGFVGGLTDRENWYEGAIGAIAPFVSGSVNAGSITNLRESSRDLIKGVDKYGNKLDVAERLSRVIINPILEEHVNAKNQDRAIDRRIKEINDLVAQNKTTLNDAAKAMMALRDYSTPLNINRYRDKDGVGASILDSEDNKLYNVFTLMDLMKALKSIEGGTKSQLYQDVMGNMEGLAKGTLSEDEMNDEIDKFLADEDNKSILDKPNKREIAAERLQKNAKYFMDAYKRYEDIDNTLSRSSLLKNADPRLLSLLRYNLMAKDNYKERLKQIEDDLGVGHTDAESKDYTANLAKLYGSESARKNALKARERSISNIEEAQKDNIEANSKALIERDNLQKELDNAKDKEAKKEAQSKLDEVNNRIASRTFQNKSLDTQKSILLAEKEELEKIIKGDPIKGEPTSILSVDDILNMNASDRAAVLDERNKGNYTELQQGIIEKAKEKLKAKDPEALQKIHDAGILHDRIANSNTVYNKLLDNADLATTWLDAQEAIRDRRAMEEKLERDIEDGYNKLNDAYDSSDPTALRNTSLSFDSQLLHAYMNDNPDKAAKVKPYYDMRKFFDDAAAIIMGNDGDLVTKRIQLGNLEAMLNGANSVEDISRNIEKVIDDPNIDAGNKAFFDNLLNEMQKLNYQRDKTTLENRKERLKREAEEKAKREAEEARKQAEAQAAAKAAAKAKEEAEAKAKAEAEAKAQAETEAKRAAEEAASNNPEGLSEEDKKKAAEVVNATPNQEVPDNAAETVGAEQKGETMPISWANGLMDSNAEEGSASAGEMWHRTETWPRKEAVTANLKIGDNGKRTITFTNGNREEELVVNPKDYVTESSAQQSVSREALPTIQTEQKSKSGKDTKGQYVDTLDNDGAHHIKYEGSNIARRSIHKEDLDKLGLSVDDILGKKEEWNNEGRYDEALEAFNEDGVEVNEATVDNKGNVTSVGIVDNGVYPTLITGSSAKKVFNAAFPELANTLASAMQKPTEQSNKEREIGTQQSGKYIPYNEAINSAEHSGNQIYLVANNSDIFAREVGAQDEHKAFIGTKTSAKTATFLPTSWNRVKSLNDLNSVSTIKGNERTANDIREVVPGEMELHEENGHKYWKVTKKAELILNNYKSSNDGQQVATNQTSSKEESKIKTTPVADRYVFSIETGSGAYPFNLKGKKGTFAGGIGDHRVYDPNKAVAHSTNAEMTDRGNGVFIYKEGNNNNPFTTIVYRNSKYIRGSRGNAGITISIDGDYTDSRSTQKILDFFKNNEAKYFGHPTTNEEEWQRLAEDLDNVINVKESNVKQEAKESTNSKESAVEVAENRPFHAKSLEKEGEDWYFVGNFEDDNKETRVKASKDFNLDMAINEQRKQREKLYHKQGSIMDVQIEEDSEGNVYGVNSTLEDQKNDVPDNMKGTIVEENSTDTDVQANVRGEEQQDNSATQLSGYPMAIWNRESLQGNERALVRDKDTKHPYSRDKLNAWLDSRGIHLRDIIDHELADILSVNPHAKVKFMATNSKDFPKTREHKDDTVSNNLFMVLDYDDSINRGITQIHDDKNGGVIETADGKKYLIIGVLAYKNGNTAQQALYNNLWGAATNSEAGTETKKRKQKAFGADDPKAKDGFGMITHIAAIFQLTP